MASQKKSDQTPNGPLDIGHAVDALLALNGDDKPYELSADTTAADPAGNRAVVRAHWKVMDVRWKGYFGGHGRDATDYRLELTLDGETGTYRYVEKLASDFVGGKTGFRGKTLVNRGTNVVRGRDITARDGQGNVTNENVTTGRIFGHEESVYRQKYRLADLKDPVFEGLQGLGWRPKHDNAWTRLWEH